jgi:hypothetical protein
MVTKAVSYANMAPRSTSLKIENQEYGKIQA